MPETVTYADLPPVPPRPADGHKGTFGTLLVVGGSREMIGAPMLAARAAYRAGVGLVRVALPAAVLPHALTLLPEAVGLALDEHASGLADAAAEADAVVAGPGLGQSADAGRVIDVLLESNRPLVLDADALNLLASRTAWPALKAPAVLTPHPGEMRRLRPRLAPGGDDVPTDDAGRADLADRAAASAGAVLLLKGQKTVVSDGRRLFVNPTGSVALAKAGAGDVLSGIIGALLAQRLDPFDAACLGAWHHGRAAERVARELGLRRPLVSEIVDAVDLDAR